jgi:hypothetical protein
VNRNPRRSDGEPTAINSIVTAKMRRALIGPTPIQSRLIETAARCAQEQDDQSILYQHSVFCQTCLPHRNPGDDVRVWERVNGRTHLEVMAGKAMHPKQERLVVADCNRKWPGLQWTRFQDRINCDYRRATTGLSATETAIHRSGLQSISPGRN